ncbi:MAG: PKD domain-containing protein [Thermodesulfobacteriota bacterium]
MRIRKGLVVGSFLMLILVSGGPLSVFASMNFNGVISSDTGWNVSDSPIVITGDVLIEQSAVLTIEPGVEVIFTPRPDGSRGHTIRVEGTLVARGTPATPIVFTSLDRRIPWGAIVFSDSSRDYNESTGTGSVIAYCIVEYGGNDPDVTGMIVTANAMPYIVGNAIRFSSSAGISSTAAANSSNLISPSGDIRIVSNQIYGNATGILFSAEGGLVADNYLLNNKRALDFSIRSHDLQVVNNTVVDTDSNAIGSAMRLVFNATVSDGPVTPAEIGITANELQAEHSVVGLIAVSVADAAAFELRITGNNFSLEGYPGYIVYTYDWAESLSTLAMTGNWWGTADSTVIDNSIYDHNNDYRLPVVEYQPIAGEAFAGAGSSLSYPPVADAGADQEAFADQEVTLDGSSSYDPDGTAVYQWRQTSGPTVRLKEPEGRVASFVAPLGGASGVVLQFQLTVSTGSGISHTDTTTVTVRPDEALPVVDIGGCFIGALSPSSISDSAYEGRHGLFLLASALFLVIAAARAARRTRLIIWSFLLVGLLSMTTPARAGYFAAGGGGGGEADEFNVTVETGANEIRLGNLNLLFGVGIPFIPHSDRALPEPTISSPCPNDDCIRLESERKGTEFGLLGKLGVEIGSTDLYLSAIGGCTIYTESELSRSEATGRIYEESSDSKIQALYGGGLSYFPEYLKWPIVIQVDYDNVRGVTGTIGWYW